MTFLGRADRQIKVRGYRIELDEIELTLSTHESVEEAVAISVPDAEGQDQIRSIVRLFNGHGVEPSDLLRHAKAHLPWYAVPAHLEIAESFPRTTTGKIDRRRLREDMIKESAPAA